VKITVIIPAYRPTHLKECLNAILNSEFKPQEIILVDDYSQDEYCKDFANVCKIIKLDRHSGPARARNVGAKAAKGDILCFIDSDVMVFKDTLKLIDDSFRKLPHISAVQTINSAYCRFTNFASQYQNLYQHFNMHSLRYEYIAAFSGHCFAVKKDVFELAGGFDENIRRASVEDGNFGMSIYLKRKKIYLNKNIKIEHVNYATAAVIFKKMYTRCLKKIHSLLKSGILFKINPDRTEHSLNKICCIAISPAVFFSAAGLMFFKAKFFMVLMAVLAVYILSSMYFICFVYRYKGAMFAIKTFFFYYLHCLVGSAGIIMGGFSFLKNKEFN